MIFIFFDTKALLAIKAPINDSKIMLKGPTGSGKSTILLERYKYMVEKLHIPSETILVLLLNRTQSLEWRSKTILEKSGAIWRTSYYGFIQGEIKTYYPIILKHCSDIINRSIKPTFLTFESAQFIVSTAIEKRRESKGVFSSVASLTDRIAADLTSNLIKAATSDIPYNEIGERLYNSLEAKDETKRQMFKEVDEIMGAYRKKCFELGLIDFGMAVELYNNCLLKDDSYKEQLFRRVRHIIVDNVEECVPTEVDFIEFISPYLDTCLLGYNHEGGYGEIFGGNHGYMASKLGKGFDIVEMSNSYTCKNYMYEFSQMLFDSIDSSRVRSYDKRPEIERVPVYELRSEMLENVGEKICRLINEDGYKASDIAVISTYADPVTEFVIADKLDKYGYGLKNIARKNRVIDNQITQSLITLAHLCNPGYGIMPNIDDVKVLLGMLLKLDPVRSSILAKDVCSQKPFAEFPNVEYPGLIERIGYNNVDRYLYIKKWIDEYKSREAPLDINDFLHKVFLDVLLSDSISESDILQVKNLIDSAQTFVDIVSRFKNMNANKGFLEMIKGGIKAADSIFELEETLNGDHVILSTPIAYLASTLKNRIIILTSLSSRNWTPRSVKEMTNSHVLTKTWISGDVYTEELEQENQRRYLAILMRTLLKRCKERLITFDSMLSANGYENDGILADYFDQVLG